MTFAFAAAGTGGHVYPALSVADALVDAGVDRSEIVFFGGDRMEAKTVPTAGFRFVDVEIRGLQRSLSPSNLTLPLVVLRAARAMAAELKLSNTSVMTVMGGYVSVPAAMAARRTKATLFLHEQNAAPGLANRLITRWAHKSFVAFPAAADHLKHTEVVGNPVRKALRDLRRDERRSGSRSRYNIPQDATVLGVLGGSLGARVLNEVTERIAVDAVPGRTAIVHLTGPTHLDTVSRLANRYPQVWRPIAFEEEMEHFYATVDLVLARSGALTVSELAVTGIPSVLVPLAATKQGANAEYLESAGGALVIPQEDIDTVPYLVEQLLADPARRRVMSDGARSRAHPDAAATMAAQLMEAARG